MSLSTNIYAYINPKIFNRNMFHKIIFFLNARHSYMYLFFLKIFYLFIFREKGERKRGRETSM